MDKVEIKQETKGIHIVQFAGTKVGKGGREKLGNNNIRP
jgi:hypothetical protein